MAIPGVFLLNELKNILRPKIFLARNKIRGTDSAFKLDRRNVSQFSFSVPSPQFPLGSGDCLPPLMLCALRDFICCAFPS